MSIPNIDFRNTELARAHLNTVLEVMLKEELDQENLCALDVYCVLLTKNAHHMIDVPYALTATMISMHLLEIGYSHDSINVLMSRVDLEDLQLMESSIVLSDPAITWVDLQVGLANKVIDFFNTLE